MSQTSRPSKLSKRNICKILRDACEGSKNAKNPLRLALILISKYTTQRVLVDSGILQYRRIIHAPSMTDGNGEDHFE